MATEPTSLINDDLLHQVQDIAREQNRQPAELVSEAVRKYLADQKWERLVTAGEKRAKARGLTEVDVPRLIEEVRNKVAEDGSMPQPRKHKSYSPIP